MGIQGLLPFLKKSCRQTKIDEFYGKTVAIDACCWLHKGAFGCAEKLVKNEKTDFYIHYCMKYIKMLLSYKIHVILVFDGASLPAKKHINAERKERRQRMKTKGKHLLAEGKVSEARDCFKQCTEITFDMISNLIKVCNSLPDVDCIIAPYEADAQLAFFNLSGIAHLIISEDSDLTVFGCSNIMFKMDHGGHGVLYEKKNLHLSLNISEEKMDFVKFRRSCILSGCDYSKGLDGIGLIKANKFFNKTSQEDLYKVLPKISTYLRMSTISVDKSFIDKFVEAENTFLYQIIFDTRSKRNEPLTPYPDDLQDNSPDLYHAGRKFEDHLAYQLALGNVDPVTHEKVNRFSPTVSGHGKLLSVRSIWNFKGSLFATDEDYHCDDKSDKKQQSAFGTTVSRVIIKNKTKSPKTKNTLHQSFEEKEKDSYCRKEKCDETPQIHRVPVVSRHFVNNFSKFADVRQKNLSSEPKNDKKSALKLLEELEDDQGARLSKSVVLSPLSIFEESPTKLMSKSASVTVNQSPDTICIEQETKHQSYSSSPLFKRKRNFLSPTNDINDARRCLRKFCYVSPRKLLFERQKNEKSSECSINNKSTLPQHSQSYANDEVSSQQTGNSGETNSISSSAASNNTDSGVELNLSSPNESYDGDKVIDLTEEEEDCDEDLMNYSQTSTKRDSNNKSSKFLGKCKRMGLNKKKNSTTSLKQTNIKDMFSAFAYKKS